MYSMCVCESQWDNDVCAVCPKSELAIFGGRYDNIISHESIHDHAYVHT